MVEKIVTIRDRNPANILKLIEVNKVGASSNFANILNLLIISEEYKNYNLDSLKIITYGTEPMPEVTLNRLNEIFPNIKFTQTYGLSEVEFFVQNLKILTHYG